jgi:hypothetical protein
MQNSRPSKYSAKKMKKDAKKMQRMQKCKMQGGEYKMYIFIFTNDTVQSRRTKSKLKNLLTIKEEQIEGTQQEPQWIVSQRILSHLQ